MTTAVRSNTVAFKSFSSIKRPNTVSLLSVPLNLGQPFLGPDKSPILLKEHGLLQLLASIGWRVEQEPDVVSELSSSLKKNSGNDGNFNAKNCAEVGAVSQRVSQQVFQHANKENNFVLILGGDHCISIGTVPGIMKARPRSGVVWVDAHADINTPLTSSSGNMHGMPLGLLLGQYSDVNKLPNFSWFQPCLKPSDIVYIGLRDLDGPEKLMIKSLGIKAFTMYDIDKLGIGKVMEETLSYLNHKESIHLSYDIDAIDPFFAPHTGTAVRGGLTFREGNFICESLYASGKLTSMELVEVNPSLHGGVDPKATIEMATTLIGSTMGQSIL